MKAETKIDVGHRSRLRDTAMKIHQLISARRSVSISEIAAESDSREATARRCWVDSFSAVYPIQVKRGAVIIDKPRATPRPSADRPAPRPTCSTQSSSRSAEGCPYTVKTA